MVGGVRWPDLRVAVETASMPTSTLPAITTPCSSTVRIRGVHPKGEVYDTKMQVARCIATTPTTALSEANPKVVFRPVKTLATISATDTLTNRKKLSTI